MSNEQFVTLNLQPDEIANIHVAKLRIFAVLFGGISERGLVRVFMAGLPDYVL